MDHSRIVPLSTVPSNEAPCLGGSSTQPKSMKGKHKTITLNTLIITLPLLLLGAVLLGLVFRRRVQHNTIYDGRLSSDMTQDEKGFIYVNINPTYLMKVASLSSTIATSLASFAVVLAAYPLAKNILRNTQKSDYGKLLTSYQYYLSLGLVEGASITAVLQSVMYLFQRHNHQKRTQQHGLRSLTRSATITLILGGLVFAAETWFHFGTKPYTFIQVSPANGNYSNILSQNCSTSSNTYSSQNTVPCSILPDIRGGTLVNPLSSLEVLGNLSKTISVNLFNGTSTPQAFLGIPGNGGPLNQDFEAITYSAATTCTPITRECGMSRDSLTSGVSVPFTCPQYPAFVGNLISDSFSIRYFSNSSGTLNSTFDVPNDYPNPFYFGVNGHSDRSAGVSKGLMNDPEVVALEFGGIAYIFFCNTTIYDTYYTSINGSIDYYVASPSNASVAKMIVLPTAVTGMGDIKLQQTATLGALSATAQEMADSLALVFSQVLMALVAGAMQHAPAYPVQQRSEIPVSRVPIAALILLVTTILLFVAWGSFLAVVAIVAAQTKDIDEVRARLSLQNLVAERLETESVHMPVENLDETFEENRGLARKRVGFGKCEAIAGGWEMKTWKVEAKDR